MESRRAWAVGAPPGRQGLRPPPRLVGQYLASVPVHQAGRAVQLERQLFGGLVGVPGGVVVGEGAEFVAVAEDDVLHWDFPFPLDDCIVSQKGLVVNPFCELFSRRNLGNQLPVLANLNAHLLRGKAAGADLVTIGESEPEHFH